MVPHYGPYLPPSPQGGGGKKPIAIDLDGNGFEFVNVDDSSIFFDVTGDGWKRRTAWVSKNDGVLAYDIDGDGKIDKPGEISFASYKEGAQSDLQGMAAFDSNHDGLFDAHDDKWARFGIWRDANQNGITDAGELRSLSDMGVQSVQLQSDGKFQVINGQTVHGIGSINMVNGSQLAMADVSLAFSNERQVPQADNTYLTRTPASPFSPSGQRIDGSDGKDLLLGNNGNDIIHTQAGDDLIFDDIGNDIIEAGVGNDTVYSGADNDYVDGGDGNDVIYAGKGIDLVIGGAGDDAIFTGDGNDIAFGADGNDFIAGGAGNDVLSGDDGDDQLMGESGNDALFGRDGNDHLLGMDGADLLDGGAGNDWLDGGADIDQMTGGSGDDTYVVDNAADSVTELADEGIDTVRTTLAVYQLADNLENLVMLAPDQIQQSMTAVGNELNNSLSTGSSNDQIFGGGGNDVLDGGAGADLMVGGSGDDMYLIDNPADSIVERADEGMDSVKASVSFTLPDQVENLMLTGSAAINAKGNQLNNQLTGNSGNNQLEGGAGADTMAGGSGNDLYVFNKGDGLDRIADSSGIDRLWFGAGLTFDNVTLRIVTSKAPSNAPNNAPNNGFRSDLANSGTVSTAQVRFLDVSGNEIAAQGLDFVVQTDQCGNLLPSIEEFQFSDGSVRSFDDMLVSVKTLCVSPKQKSISGGRDDEIILGNSQANAILAGSGHDAIYAGVGKDTIAAGNGNDFIAGGKGDDTINTGNGKNIIAFNRGDGRDTLLTSAGALNSLSLGGGITLNDLSLQQVGKDLVIGLGRSDSMSLRGWYDGNANRNLVNLQIIHEASANRMSTLLADQYDFANIVAQFDMATASRTLGSSWSLMKAKLDTHLGAEFGVNNKAALGGDLSFDYAVNRDFTLSQSAAGDVLRNPAFGVLTQSHQQRFDGSNAYYRAS